MSSSDAHTTPTRWQRPTVMSAAFRLKPRHTKGADKLLLLVQHGCVLPRAVGSLGARALIPSPFEARFCLQAGPKFFSESFQTIDPRCFGNGVLVMAFPALPTSALDMGEDSGGVLYSKPATTLPKPLELARAKNALAKGPEMPL